MKTKTESVKWTGSLGSSKHINQEQGMIPDWKILEFPQPKDKGELTWPAILWMTDDCRLFVTDPYWFAYSKRYEILNGEKVPITPAFYKMCRPIELRAALEWIVEVGNMTVDAEGGVEDLARIVLKIMNKKGIRL